MNVSLIGKDNWIDEMKRNIDNLNDKFGKLSLELDKVKLIVIDAFKSVYKKVVRQSKHFFINKELDFDLLNSTKF